MICVTQVSIYGSTCAILMQVVFVVLSQHNQRHADVPRNAAGQAERCQARCSPQGHHASVMTGTHGNPERQINRQQVPLIWQLPWALRC